MVDRSARVRGAVIVQRLPLVCAVFLLLAVPAFGEDRRDPGEWAAVRPGYSWSFPEDHWPHPEYKTEWYYFTGHLADRANPDRRLGFQFTFFRIGLLPRAPDLDSAWSARDLIMGHAAVSDPARGAHRFSDVLRRAVPLLGGFGVFPEPLIAWCRPPAGTGGRWTMTWNGEGFDVAMADDAAGFAFELTTRPARPLVFQGPGGYSEKDDEPGAASHYYSFTRLETAGTVRIGADELDVRGLSWMDREFFTRAMGTGQTGWDWFSLQLEDGRDLMLYVLRDREGKPDFGRGTLVGAGGRPRYLEPTDWRLEATAHWRSPITGADYPVAWRLRLPGEGLDLEIRALFPDQENVGRRSGGIAYWEGAVEVRSPGGPRSGKLLGRGYAELTGYAPGNRPPI